MSGDEDYSTSNPRQWLGRYDTISTAVNGTETKTHADRIVTWTDTATKGRNPDWRRDIAMNRNATTNLTGYSCKVVAYEGECKAQKKVKPASGSYLKEVYGEFFTPTISTSAVLSNISSAASTNMAKTRFLKKLIDAQQELESLVSLGEGRETLRMLNGAAKGLWHGVRNWKTVAKKLRPRNASRQLAYTFTRDLPSLHEALRHRWLEHAFGWRPFIADIEAAGQTINRWNDYYMEKLSIRAGGDEETSTVTDSEQIDGVFRFRKTEQVVTSCITVYAGSVKSIAMNPVKFRAELMGFKPQNFVPTVWELIPYSFLVDYFTNIGDILNGWAHQRGRLAWARQTVIKSKTWRCVSIPRVADATYYPVVLVPSLGESVSKQVSRTPYTDSFMPDFEFEIPGLSLKWLNMAALARGRRL